MRRRVDASFPDDGARDEPVDGPDYVLSSGSIGVSILSVAIATLLVLSVAAIAVLILARVFDLSPGALLEEVLPIHGGQPSQAIDPAPAEPVPAATPKPLQSRAVTSRAWAMWKDVPQNLYDPAVDVQRAFNLARVFPAGFDIPEGGTMQSDQTRIRLAEIVSLPAATICLSDQSTKFACGLQARASLSILASHEKLVCYPDVSIDTDTPQFLCQARGRDLSLAQIEAGYALPAQPSIDELVQLAAKARAAHAGAWNGDWTILPPGGATVPAKDTAQ